jgi:hypothetical protein
MATYRDLSSVWSDLAALIATLPKEERRRYIEGFHALIHDMRQNIGNIYSAETLIRRELSEKPETVELLDVIRTASQRTMGMITDLARPFDKEITTPITRPPFEP